MDNGDPIDTLPHHSTNRKTFHGKLLAVVRRNDSKEGFVTFSCDGMEEVIVHLTNAN